MSRSTKTIFLIGLVILIYGFLCRELNFYFFWDSKSIGWIILFVGLIGYFYELNAKRSKLGKKTIWLKIALGFLLAGIPILPTTIFLIKSEDAYQAAVEELRGNQEVIKEFGRIKGFGLIPTGTVTTTTINNRETGHAIFNLTIRGTKKYKDITVTLEKTHDTFWAITGLE